MAEPYRGSLREKLGERVYNNVVTHIPSHFLRQSVLRLGGAKIGRDTSILGGSTVLGLGRLRIGDCCSIGFRVLLDARGGLDIDDDCVLASDVQIITAKHIVDSDDFGIDMGPVHIKHHAWIASRATILQDVTVGVGAVVGACSLVNSDVDDMAVVAGVPARLRGKRNSSLQYRPKWRPLLY